MIKNVLKVSAVMLVLGLASGCAATGDQAQATADAAARDAALHGQQPIAQHRQLQPLKAQPIGLCQQRPKHKLAVMQTAIAWNACSRGHSPSSK